MREELLNRLVVDGHFVAGGEIDAEIPVVGIGHRSVQIHHTCTVLAIYRAKSGKILMDVLPLDGNNPKTSRIGSGAIVRIDGMLPERLAEHYELDEFGEKLIVTAKRRGRAPKSMLGVGEEDFDDDD